MKTIGMVGYFGWGNFGDELFLKVHQQQLGSTYNLKVVHDLQEEPYYSRPVAEIVDEYDGFLIGGGDLLNPLRVSGLYWQMDYLRKPVFIYGLGVPNQPFQRAHVLSVYRKFFEHENCKLIVARDVESYEWIKRNLEPGSKLTWYPDPVCAMDRPEPLPPTNDKTLGVVMREHRSLEQDMSSLRRMIDAARDMGYTIRHLVLANMSLGEGDLRRAQLIAQPDEEVFYTDDLDEMCRQVSACSMLATIKFHGLVVATMYGVPAVALSVTPKNRNFLKMIERQEMMCSYTNPDLHERISYFPARIHQRVRAGLYYRAREGYEHLRQAMHEALAEVPSESPSKV